MVRKIFFILLLMLNVAYADCSTILVGVTESNGTYKGILANLTVKVVKGSGNVWVDTMPLTRIETQVSARIAKEVSCESLNFNCSNLDFYYLLRSDSPLVGGPSAGATMTACTMAALLNVSLDKDVAVTGTINPDGSIGPVGSINAKATALKNYHYFLIPEDSLFNLTNSNLKVVKVSDIYDVFKYLTGYDVRPKINISVVNNDYNKVMKKMDESLISEARNNLNGSEALDLLNDSLLYYYDKNYYSSASYAVRSLIYSFYESLKPLNSSPVKINKLISNITCQVNSFKKDFLSDLVINHIYDLESFAITIDRINEAEGLLKQANQSINNLSFNNALFYISFAKARLITSRYWSSLLNYFNDTKTIKLNINNIKPLIIEKIESARNSITYAETLMNPLYFISPISHLNNAINSFNNGDYIYSLFEALKSRAEANLLMELNGFTNMTSRIEYKKKLAQRAIINSMNNGYLPLLSLSFLEYSNSFKNDSYQQLLFLSYAREFSSLGYSLNKYYNYLKPINHNHYQIRNTRLVNYLLIFVVGFVTGLVLVMWGVKL